MTAEVAIANANGIALAADSAVTIGDQKIYNSALKLFSLSKIEPVGVMIYGNASLLGVPWETIIKTFREQLKTASNDVLESYGDDFIKYIKTKTEYFSAEDQKEWIRSNAINYFGMMKKELEGKMHEIFLKNGKVDDAETKTVFHELIASHHASLKSKSLVVDATLDFERSVRKKFAPIIDAVIADTFGSLPIGSTQTKCLRDISAFLQTRSVFANNSSGIVIAGYGRNEIYPSVTTYEIEGIVDGRIKYRHVENKSFKIKNGSTCCITAFAQEDMVNSFMQGLNPSVSTLMDGYLHQVFSRLTELIDLSKAVISTQDKDELLSNFTQNSNALLKDFFAALNDHIKQQHIMPILSMVRVLPKDELAAMAESLVNLTAFKRRMTDSLETVGGPIDVAVISKGDGLIWVKRKHYFPKELNQHFFRNYFRGIEND